MTQPSIVNVKCLGQEKDTLYEKNTDHLKSQGFVGLHSLQRPEPYSSDTLRFRLHEIEHQLAESIPSLGPQVEGKQHISAFRIDDKLSTFSASLSPKLGSMEKQQPQQKQPKQKQKQHIGQKRAQIKAVCHMYMYI